MQNGLSKKQTSPTAFEVLKTQVYPTLNEAMLKLIDHIVKTQEVRKHQERLVKEKLLDKLEMRKIQREKQKEQLGSDYFESDDDNDFKGLNMDKSQVDKIFQNRASLKLQQQETEILVQNEFNPIKFLVQQLKQMRQENSVISDNNQSSNK